MSAAESAERRARVALSFMADPGDLVLGAALRSMTAVEVLAATTGTDDAGDARLAASAPGQALGRAISRWRTRISLVPSVARLAAWQDSGLRLVVPGDPEWPVQLEDLGDSRPLLLWVRGTADLGEACADPVSVVGARAAAGYGQHVGLEMAAVLAERGLGIVSGGAYTTKSQLRAQRLCDLGRAVMPMSGGRDS